MPTGTYGRQQGKWLALAVCAFAAGAAPARAGDASLLVATFDMPTLLAGGLVMLYVWRYRNLLLF